jgi:hypothetical protein
MFLFRMDKLAKEWGTSEKLVDKLCLYTAPIHGLLDFFLFFLRQFQLADAS